MKVDLIFVLQWVAVLFGVLQVWYSKENRPVNYLFGIISVLCNIYVLFVSKLYAESLLNGYYLIMSIYGWWFWLFGKKEETTQQVLISSSTKREYILAGSIVLFSFCVFYFGLYHITDSDVPHWDALVSAFAWAGMWLLARRKIENWIFLNISNVISIPLLFYKGLPIYAGFTILLFVMAIWGYINWYKLMRTRD